MYPLRSLFHLRGTAIAAFLFAFPIAALGQTTNVFTWHNDIARTGLNQTEAVLTHAKVNSSNFGLRFQINVDGKVDAQPLYVATIEIDGTGSHNVLLVATEHDSVYAFDADNGSQLWKVSLLGSGETPSDDRGCDEVTPEIGVTSTPVVLRRDWWDGSLYVVAMSKDADGNYHQRLHALDLRDGSEQFAGPTEIAATAPGTGDNSSNGSVVFDAKQYKERAALLLVNSDLFTSWSSHCDAGPYNGWVIAYDRATLQQTVVFNTAPNGSGAAPWNSGAGPAADNSADVYYALGNGTFDTSLTRQGFPSQGDYGNSVLKMRSQNSTLKLRDYWTMYNSVAESAAHTGLGSGGVMLLPNQKDANGRVRHLEVTAGKDGNLYVLDRDNMGKFDPVSNSGLYQELDAALPGGVSSSPAYFNGHVYYSSVGGPLQSFVVDKARLVGSPSSTSSNTFGFPGTTPSISARVTAEPIVWAVESGDTAVLHAYDANDLGTELYNSNQAGTRDNFGPGNNFVVPMIANGKVFVGTQNSVAVFGILPQSAAPLPDGLYDLWNHSSGLLLNNPELSRLPNIPLIQYPQSGGVNEHWFFTYQGNGYYTIQNATSWEFLTDVNGNTEPGTSVLQTWVTNDDTQLWTLIPIGTGYLVQNKASSLVLDDPNRSPTPGAVIDLWIIVDPDPAVEAFYINDIWSIKPAG